MRRFIKIYDTTLRDGTQGEGVSFSMEDKVRLATRLDAIGIHYIEGGWPGSNPKDLRFFRRMQDVSLKHAKLAAFSMTRRAGVAAASDANMQALVDAGAPVATIVGKAWDFHVTQALGTTLEENLAMVQDTIAYLRPKMEEVLFDAEHFFDGFHGDPDYSLQCLATAARAGADALVLCDTNGGMTTPQMLRAIHAAIARVRDVRLGIHCHNDAGLAVANSLAAVDAGVWQVQGCVNGYGERCGNADILTILANLKLKMGLQVVEDEQLARLTEVSNYVSELANLVPAAGAPYVGASAFAHKAGYHVAGIMKDERAYQHIEPAAVGNTSRVLVSELSGQRNLLMKLDELDIDYPFTQDEIKEVFLQVAIYCGVPAAVVAFRCAKEVFADGK